MPGKFNFKVGALCAALTVLLIVPALVQAKGVANDHLKEVKAQILKELRLSPDKEQAFMAVDDKYAADRHKIIVDLKQSRKDLQTALTAAKPDDAKIRGLVSAITTSEDKLLTSFRNQRDEELAVLSPADQGKYMLALSRWRHKMMEKFYK